MSLVGIACISEMQVSQNRLGTARAGGGDNTYVQILCVKHHDKITSVGKNDN